MFALWLEGLQAHPVLVTLALGFAVVLFGLLLWLWRRAVQHARTVAQNAEQQLHDTRASYEEMHTQLHEQIEDIEAHKQHLQGQLAALEKLHVQHERLQSEHTALKVHFGQLKTQTELEQRFHQERLTQAQKSQDQLQATFEQLSSKVFKAQQQDFTQVAQAQLQPIKQQMEQFRGKMEELNRYDSKDRTRLMAELEHLKTANQKISEEAVNLTNALTSQAKQRGLWGEAVLERVLEASGLRKGEEYQTQVSFEQQGKRYLPDVVVNLPDDKQVIIDAKAVMLDYERYVNAAPEEQAAHVKRFVDQLKAQVKSLADKKYHKITPEAVDLVLLFVPIEGAFQTLLETHAEVFQEAIRQSVVITSPSTLMATLRLIHLLWQQERQQKNAHEIAEMAGKLYDQMALMLASFNDVGDKLDKAKGAFDKTVSQLSEGRGNVLKKAKQLKELGAKTKKQITFQGQGSDNVQG